MIRMLDIIKKIKIMFLKPFNGTKIKSYTKILYFYAFVRFSHD